MTSICAKVRPAGLPAHGAPRAKKEPASLIAEGDGQIPGGDLLSQDLSSQYHRRCGVSLPGSEWDRVVPPRSGHQRATLFVQGWVSNGRSGFQSLASRHGSAGSTGHCLSIAGHWLVANVHRSLTSAWSFQIHFNQPQFVHFEPRAVTWEASDSERNQARRMISTSKLHILLRFHFWPINVVVFHDPSGKTHLGRSLALRCFQRLSLPHLATRPCS
jgi:hypothetical protein